MTQRDIALDIAVRFLGTPYIWGGNDPMRGFDCSGFVIEILKSVGVLPRAGDWTADGLLGRFQAHRTTSLLDLVPGMLVFWARPDGGMRHVEMVYAIPPECVTPLTIGASGGGSSTLSLGDAVAQDAYIKIRPIAPGWKIAADPFA
jgi:hypothetical protein